MDGATPTENQNVPLHTQFFTAQLFKNYEVHVWGASTTNRDRRYEIRPFQIGM